MVWVTPRVSTARRGPMGALGASGSWLIPSPTRGRSMRRSASAAKAQLLIYPGIIDILARTGHLCPMDKQSRRNLARDYKERKVPAGIFSLRCAATGETWVGAARNLDQKNGLMFSLRLGSHR